MTRATKILCTVIFITFAFTGVSFGTTIDKDYEFLYPDDSQWAVLNVQATNEQSTAGWWYTYTLTVQNDTYLDVLHEVHEMRIRIMQNGIDNLSEDTDTGVNSNDLFIAGDVLFIDWDGLGTGDSSSPITFRSDYAPALGTVEIQNNSQTSQNSSVKVALGALDYGAGEDTPGVPEPATMMVLSIGVLSAAGAHLYRRSRKGHGQ